MARLHLNGFSGLQPELDARLLHKVNAQIAHNCVLTDGTIRPMPAWEIVNSLGGGNRDETNVLYSTRLIKPVLHPLAGGVELMGAPFHTGVIVGATAQNGIKYFTTQPYNTSSASIYTMVQSSSVTYSRSYNSDKPVNRLYAVSFLRSDNGAVDEGPLHILTGQSPKDVLYEGDLVNVTIGVSGGQPNTSMNLYRTITGMDTGEVITNELDTEWHLVANLPTSGTVTYIDGDSATALPLDMYYAGRNQPLDMEDPAFFGLTEQGYFIAANRAGRIAISERFKFHAWPTEGYLSIPETITDLKVHTDSVYIGTERRPYMMAVSQGESSVQAAIQPYQEYLPCRPRSMAVAAGGVMYASVEGLVLLSREGARVVTASTLGADTKVASYMYVDTSRYPNTRSEEIVGPANTYYGAYHAGTYYGFPRLVERQGT